MIAAEVVKTILQDRVNNEPENEGIAFAPVNIALIKYWGKRDTELNLPITSSLSVSLNAKGSQTNIKLITAAEDLIILNKEKIANNSVFARRLIKYLDLFRFNSQWHFAITIATNVPIAAGLASSAAGFASIIMALNGLFNWQLSKRELSILARLGSGSACRSLWHGFVKWQRGELENGLDSFAEPLPYQWPELCIGLLIFSGKQKAISSRQAMEQTVKTSTLYSSWPQQVAQDMPLLEQAIKTKDFQLLGKNAESNALAMHATMLSSWPPIAYALPETVAAMQYIWQLRAEGRNIYFTQDAGPNLKLLFLQEDIDEIKRLFPALEIINIGAKL